MSLPTPYTVELRTFSADGRDTHGNPVNSWAAAVPVPVIAIAPGAMAEPDQPNRDLSEVLFTIFCPAGTSVSERDRIVLDGLEYDVEGAPRDWTRGPWAHPTAGVVIELKRVEG